jgi:hypothetical protein
MAQLTYIHCPQCGQKALPVATQCPKCGHPFETQFPSRRIAPSAGPGRVRLGLFIAGAVAIVVVVNAVRDQPTIVTGAPPSGITGAPPSGTEAAVDSSRPARAEPPRESRPRARDLAQPAAPAREQEPSPELREPVEAPAAEPGDTGSAEVRYATTWVNVRAARSPTAPVVHVLRPGDTVMVDSLQRGWYRAGTDGEMLGYVFRGLLDTAPPHGNP